MQTLPDVFRPPAFWGAYPSFGAPQTTRLNVAGAKPPTQTAPDYGDGKGIGIGTPIGSSLAGIQAQKTVFAGSSPIGSPAQLVWSTDATGTLKAYDNVTGRTFTP